MDEEHRTKKVAEILKLAARKAQRAKQTGDLVRALKLQAEVAKLRAEAAKLEAGH